MRSNNKYLQEFESSLQEIVLKYPNPFKSATAEIYTKDEFQKKSDQYCRHLIGLFQELTEISRITVSLAESKLLSSALMQTT